jgi:hypothetical protein
MSSEEKKEEKPVKLEKVAEETGEVIGKGIRKTWNVAKSFGKGLVTTLETREEQKDTTPLNCQNCGITNQPNSNFCSSCGKKL